MRNKKQSAYSPEFKREAVIREAVIIGARVE